MNNAKCLQSVIDETMDTIEKRCGECEKAFKFNLEQTQNQRLRILAHTDGPFGQREISNEAVASISS